MEPSNLFREFNERYGFSFTEKGDERAVTTLTETYKKYLDPVLREYGIKPWYEGEEDNEATREVERAYEEGRLEIDDLYNRRLKEYLAESDDPIAEIARINTVRFFSNRYRIPVNEADARYDELVRTYHREAASPIDTWDAIKRSWEIGAQSRTLGELYAKEAAGFASEYDRERIREIEFKMPQSDTEYRGLFGEVLKSAAQAAPGFLLDVGTGLAAGALTLGLGSAVTIPATALKLASAAFAAGSFVSATPSIIGLEYKDLLDRGVDREVARVAAISSGLVQGVIETSLGLIPGAKAAAKTLTLASKFGKEIAEEAIKKSIFSGTITKIAEKFGKQGAVKAASGVAGYLKEAASEGMEEVYQQLASNLAGIVADIASTAKGKVPDELTGPLLNIPQLTENFVQGFQAALVLGLPAASFNAVVRAGSRSDAKAEGAAKDQLEKTLQAPQPEQGSDGVVAITDKAREAASKASIPLEERIKYQGARTEQDLGDGIIRRAVLAGDPTTGKRRGYAEYKVEGDTVTIESIKLSKKDDPAGLSIARGLVIQVGRENPGKTIDWSPVTQELRAVKETIIAENPRGKDAGLNWYDNKESIRSVDERARFRAEVRRAFSSLTDEEVNLGMQLVDSFARAKGMKAGDWLARYVAGVRQGQTTAMGETLAEGAKGLTEFVNESGIRVSFKEIEGRVKGIITATERADFSTLAHELFHVAERLSLAEGQKAAIEEYFGKKYHELDADDMEALAYGFEKYLASGKAPTEGLRAWFSRVAEIMVRFIKGQWGEGAVPDKLRSFYDSLLSEPESGLAKAEAAVAESAQAQEALYTPDGEIDEETAQEISEAVEPKQQEKGEEKRSDEKLNAPMKKENLSDFDYGEIGLFQREIDRVVFTFPEGLKGYSDIHSQAQLGGALQVFGRGVIGKDGEIRIGDAGSSHVQLGQGMADAIRFYFGVNRGSKAVYVVAKNSMDAAKLRTPEALKRILSAVFDKYRLTTGGKRLTFSETEALYQRDEALTKEAVKRFGLTTDAREAGYILPDGRMLDFSAKNDKSQPQAPWEEPREGRRYWGHSTVKELPGLGETDSARAIYAFMARTGAIRVEMENGVVESIGTPSDRQLAIVNREAPGQLQLEVYDKHGISQGFARLRDPTPLRVRRFYDDPSAEHGLYQVKEEDFFPSKLEETKLRKQIEIYNPLDKGRDRPYEIGTVGPVLHALGFDDLPLYMPGSKLRKTMLPEQELAHDGQPGHQLSVENILAVQAAIRDPEAVYLDQMNVGRVVVVTSVKDHAGRKIVAVVQNNGAIPGKKANLLITAYGHADIARWEGKLHDSGLLIYEKEKDSRALARGNRPKDGRKSSCNVMTRAAVVNGVVKEIVPTYRQDALYQRKAYHGTPHEVDKFSTEYIGTGEGAQAYGWGLYFAGDKEVADWYREKLSKPRSYITFPYGDGEKYYFTGEAGDLDENAQDLAPHESLAARILYASNIDEIRAALAEAKGEGSNLLAGDEKAFLYKGEKYPIADTEAALDLIESGEIEIGYEKGHLYEVSIPNDDEYLDWDKPLSEQSDKVKKALSGDKRAKDSLYGNGGEYYRGLVARHVQDAAINLSVEEAEEWAQEYASRELRSLGIPGIRYLDGNSRGGKNNSYNYVIFSDDDVTIDKVLLQTEDELIAEAKSFASRDEFIDYMSFAYTTRSKDDAIPGFYDMSPEARLEELGKWWDKANKKGDYWEPKSKSAARDEFIESLTANNMEGLKRFLIDWIEWDADRRFEGRIKGGGGASYTGDYVRAIAHRIYKREPVTEQTMKSLLTRVRNNVDRYRYLWEQIYQDDDMRRQLEAEQKGLAPEGDKDIEPPKTWREMKVSPVDLIHVAQGVKDKDKRDKILAGQRTWRQIEADYKEIVEKLREKNREIRDLSRELDAQYERFDYTERKVADSWAKYVEARRARQRAERDRLVAQRNGRTDRVEAINKRIVELRATEKAELARTMELFKIVGLTRPMKGVANIAVDEAVKDAKAEARAKALADHLNLKRKYEQEKAAMREKERERRAVKAERERKRYLASQIMRPPAKSCKLSYKRAIEQLQAQIYPGFRRALKEWNIADLREQVARDPGLATFLPPEVLDRLERKGLEEWTIEELEELAQRVADLRAEGAAARRADLARRRIEANNAQAEAVEELKKHPARESYAYGSKEAEKQKHGGFLGAIKGFDLASTQVVRFAEKLGPVFTEILVTKERDAQRKEWEIADRRINGLLGAVKDAGLTLDHFYKKKVRIGNSTYTKADVLGMYLAMKDPDARAHLIFGNFLDAESRKSLEGMDTAAIENIEISIAREIEAATATLTEAELKVAEYMARDYRESYAPLADAVEELENRRPPQVESYFPIEAKDRSGQGDLRAQLADDLLKRAGFARGTEKGNTLERIKIGKAHQTPISTDAIGVYRRSVEKSAHYIAYAAWGLHAKATFQGRDSAALRFWVRQTYGDEYLDYLDTAIAEMLNPRSFTEGSAMSSRIDRAVKALQGPLATAYLGLRFSTAFRQLLTSPIPYFAYVRPDYLVKNLIEALNPRGTIQFVEEKSAFFRHRVANPALAAVQRMKDGPLKGFNALAMKGIEWADRISVAAGWKAVYEQAIHEGLGEKAAIERADDVTIRCQPTGRETDLAPIFRDKGVIRLITMFQSPLNVIYNQMRHDLPRALAEGHIIHSIGLVSTVAAVGAIIAMLAAPRDEDDDEEAKGRRLLFGMLSQPFESILFVGEGASRVLEEAITGNARFRGARDLFPGVNKVIDGLGGAFSGDFDAAKAAEGLGTLLGLPVSAAKEYMRALQGDLGAIIGRPKQ